MSKRISVTVSDEQYKALVMIAEANQLPVATTVYYMLQEWIQARALSMQIADQLDAIDATQRRAMN